MAIDVLSETKISTGFLTVVPKEVRQLIGAREGDLLQWHLQGEEIRVRIRRPKTVADIVGIISHGGDAVARKRAVQGMRPRVR
jgi:bifunctional DNA-binding transcriptional regulator/antitoxin component of YhaV-PrlF toxin-antitoxin module